MAAAPDRPYDVVVLGATGFTGALTAAAVADDAPPGLRWAVAGRNPAKLDAARDRLVAEHPAAPEPATVVADATDAASLRELASSTRVLVTTVGPYVHHGFGVVAACAVAGT